MNRTEGGKGSTRWSREDVIAGMQRWQLLYGAAPAAGEWNPSMAKRLGHAERVERFYEGRWPNYRTVVKLFGGWNDAIQAAGLKPRPRGGRRGQKRESVATPTPSPIAPAPISEPQPGLSLKGIADELEIPGAGTPEPWWRALLGKRS